MNTEQLRGDVCVCVSASVRVCCELWGDEESMTSLLQGIYKSNLSFIAAVVEICN